MIKLWESLTAVMDAFNQEIKHLDQMIKDQVNQSVELRVKLIL